MFMWIIWLCRPGKHILYEFIWYLFHIYHKLIIPTLSKILGRSEHALKPHFLEVRAAEVPSRPSFHSEKAMGVIHIMMGNTSI